MRARNKRAVSMIRCVMWKLSLFDHKDLFIIFFSSVVPVLCYTQGRIGLKFDIVYLRTCRLIGLTKTVTSVTSLYFEILNPPVKYNYELTTGN